MSRGVEKEFEDAVEEEAALMAKMYDEAFASYGSPMANTHGDREFVLWFLMNLAQYGPNWALALEYVEGGKDQLRRFTRLTQGVGNASTGI